MTLPLPPGRSISRLWVLLWTLGICLGLPGAEAVFAQDLCDTGTVITRVAIGVPFKVVGRIGADTSHAKVSQKAPGTTGAVTTIGEIPTSPGACAVFDVPAQKVVGVYTYTMTARNVDPANIASVSVTDAPPMTIEVFQPTMPKPAPPGMKIIAYAQSPDGELHPILVPEGQAIDVTLVLR